MIFLDSKFVILFFALIFIGTPLVQASFGEEGAREAFGISPEVPIEPALRQLIVKYEELLIDEEGDAQEINLFLGDAYHWLGHVLSETAKLPEALDSFLAAQSYYGQTESKFSARIGMGEVNCLDHIIYHLTETKISIFSGGAFKGAAPENLGLRLPCDENL